jgi:hypothetical protein
MGFFELPSEKRLAVGEARKREEAILEVTRQKGTVSQVLDRLSLGVQHALYSFDELIATGQEELEKFDMCLKRKHFAKSYWIGAPPAGTVGMLTDVFVSHDDALLNLEPVGAPPHRSPLNRSFR